MNSVIDQVNNLLYKYPSLYEIAMKYGHSNLWLKYNTLLGQIEGTDDLVQCAITKLLGLVMIGFSFDETMLGFLNIIFDPSSQIKNFEFRPHPGDMYIYSFLEISQVLEKTINRKADISIIHLTLLSAKPAFAHANILLVNKLDRSIEHFEPHLDISPSLKIHELYDFLAGLAGSIGYSYIPPLYYCPNLGSDKPIEGWQSKEGLFQREKDQPEGYCVIWSIFYAYLRIVYPEIDPREIINDFTIIEPQSLRIIIRMITSMVVDLCTQ